MALVQNVIPAGAIGRLNEGTTSRNAMQHFDVICAAFRFAVPSLNL